MKSFYLLAFLLAVLLSCMPVEGQVSAACTTCCTAYWTCMAAKIFTFGFGQSCSSKFRYCLGRCECYKFA
eukprot:UN02532